MTRLLDINLLLALVDPVNVHHDRAHEWLERNRRGMKWATCALTENGFCRILGSSAYPGNLDAAKAAQLLIGLRNGIQGHEFWHCDISLVEAGLIDWELVQESKPLTHLYLVALAAKHRGRFVTFEPRIRWEFVRSANSKTVEVL